jgi:hydroxymethylbilane synthase
MTPLAIKLGTRGSALAIWQANWVKAELERRTSNLSVELILIKTTGDKILDVPLAKIGGKGLFTKEIDEALLDGRIDIAVHSLKDVPFQLPEGIDLAAVPEREDGRDAFISNGPKLRELTTGATIGTSSLRRQVQLRHHYPALNLAVLRGNVDTRLRKLSEGQFDAIVLAVAGLKRLGHEARITEILTEDIMLPAVAQGALGIVCRAGDRKTRELLITLEDPVTRLCVTAERSLLRALGGSCQVPVAGKAVMVKNRLQIQALIASLDGKRVLRTALEGSMSNPVDLGWDAGQQLIAAGASELLAEIMEDGSHR